MNAEIVIRLPIAMRDLKRKAKCFLELFAREPKMMVTGGTFDDVDPRDPEKRDPVFASSFQLPVKRLGKTLAVIDLGSEGHALLNPQTPSRFIDCESKLRVIMR